MYVAHRLAQQRLTSLSALSPLSSIAYLCAYSTHA
jgi:hypothetical protein